MPGLGTRNRYQEPVREPGSLPGTLPDNGEGGSEDEYLEPVPGTWNRCQEPVLGTRYPERGTRAGGQVPVLVPGTGSLAAAPGPPRNRRAPQVDLRELVGTALKRVQGVVTVPGGVIHDRISTGLRVRSISRGSQGLPSGSQSSRMTGLSGVPLEQRTTLAK